MVGNDTTIGEAPVVSDHLSVRGRPPAHDPVGAESHGSKTILPK